MHKMSNLNNLKNSYQVPEKNLGKNPRFCFMKKIKFKDS